MGIALFTLSSLLAPLQGLVSWFMPPAPRTMCPQPAFRPRALRAAPRHAPVTDRACAARPLRVLRVVEPNQVPASAGRMVISGRMADVCAELDRLAALEARH